MKNPKPITRFGYSHLASLVLLFVNNMIHWDFNLAVYTTDPRLAGVGATGFYLSILAPILVPLLLWSLVVWKRSNLARWIIVAYFVLWALGVAGTAGGNLPASMVTMTVIALLLQGLAVYFLFRPESASWLGVGEQPNENAR